MLKLEVERPTGASARTLGGRGRPNGRITGSSAVVVRRRARDVVRFHCPVCGTDRLGEPGGVGWTSRPWVRRLRGDGADASVACLGCRRIFGAGVAGRGPVGTSARARLNLAVRAIAASLVAAGDGDPRTVDAAIELVRRCTTLTFHATNLRADLGEHDLPTRLRGDLTLLAADLSPRAASQLLDQAHVVVGTGAVVTAGQYEVLDACAEYLGLAGRSVSGVPDPRRRGVAR